MVIVTEAATALTGLGAVPQPPGAGNPTGRIPAGERGRTRWSRRRLFRVALKAPFSAVDDHAEVGTDDAQGVAEVDRDEEGLVDVHVADHDPQGDALEVDVADVDDVAGLVRRGDRPQGQGDGVLVQGQVGVATARSPVSRSRSPPRRAATSTMVATCW